jgi:hypothetical protein
VAGCADELWLGMLLGMACAEKLRQLEKYTAATSAFHAAIAELWSKTGAELPKNLAATEAARAESTRRGELS